LGRLPYQKVGCVKQFGSNACALLVWNAYKPANASRLTDEEHRPMPTLTRLILWLLAIFAVLYGAMFALANFVTPKQTEITIEVPLDALNKNP
jgi:hypothetical protein